MRYEVRALNSDNRIDTLILEAVDESGARHAAACHAQKVLTVKPARAIAGRQRGASFDLTLFAQELLVLVEAGLAIVEALEAMQEKEAPGAVRDVAAALAQALRGGQRLSQALASRPEHFPPIFVGLIQAAETTSDLPSALSRYVDFASRLAQVRSKTISAAIYPSILLVVGSGVTLFLLCYVVPRFASVYEDSGRSMSFLTALLFEWGSFVSAHTSLLLLVLAAVTLSAALGWQLLRQRYGMTDVLARLPGIRQHVHRYEMARLYVTTGLLLSGGIPMVRALTMVQATLSAGTRHGLMRAIPRVASGEAFSVAMATEGLAGPVAVRLFRVGEQAGKLGEMLLRTSRYYDTEVTRFIDRFTRAAEPILMAAIGLVVGAIVVLLYMPIFELAGSVQ